MRFHFAVTLLFCTCMGAICSHAETQQVREVETFCRQSLNSPAAYRAKLWQDAYFVRCGEALSEPSFEKKKALSELKRLKREVSMGRNWQTPLLNTTIPFLVRPPLIDGEITQAEWRHALFFNREYLLSRSEPLSECGACWYIGYNHEYIFFAAQIKDPDLLPGPSEKPYGGDAVEVFLHPDKRLANYLETVVSCNGNSYQARAAQTAMRHFDIEPLKKTVAVTAVKANGSGYCIEGKIPFSALPGYFLGNLPKAGESMNFMLICCRLNRKGEYSRTTPYPFLYDGHNIYGYIQGTLGKQN